MKIFNSLLLLVFISFISKSVVAGIVVVNDRNIEDTSRPILYFYTDIVPKYPGGNKKFKEFVAKNLSWPKEEVDYSGIIITSFIIEKNGAVSNIKIERGTCSPCNLQCIKMISLMPKWSPGIINNKPVRTLIILPIDYELIE